MKTYTLNELIKIYSEFESTDWEAISTVEFLTYLFELEEKEKEMETNSPFDSAMDAQADYSEEGR